VRIPFSSEHPPPFQPPAVFEHTLEDCFLTLLHLFLRAALLDLFNGHSPSKASIVHRKNRLWAIVDFPSVELASTAKRSLDDSGTVQEAGWTVRFGDENVKVESAKVLKDEFEPSERLYVPVVPAGSTAESEFSSSPTPL
jgi:hypothetical protein